MPPIDVFFVYTAVCLVEAAILIAFIEDSLMGQKTAPIRSKFALTLLGLPIVAGIAVTIAYLPLLLFKQEWSQADPYGLLNAVVSALAFAAIIVSLWYQQHELSLQRKELRLQRKELHQSLEEYKKMADAQESSDKRLFFTAYLNALNALRESNLHPAVGNTNKPHTVLPAVRQRAVIKQLTKVLKKLADDGERLYGISSDQDDEQRFLEEFGSSVSSLLKLCQFSQGHGKFDSVALAPHLDDLSYRLTQCRNRFKQSSFLHKLAIDVGDLANESRSGNFNDEKWEAVQLALRQCVELINTML